LAYESRSKETAKTVRHNVHIVECDKSSSDDESTEVYTAEMVWPKQAKSSACSSLQPIQKKRQEEVKFTFNVGKCAKIFDELLKNGNIKINHTVPSADELKRRAYCKWHNSFSHATNNCNVFRRHIQSSINEGRLKFQEMQVDTGPFPMNIIDFEGKRILVRPNTTDKGKDKEIIIGNAREADGNHKISCRKVVAEKTPDRGETLKVTITTSSAGGQAQTKGQEQEPVLRISDGPTHRRRWSGTAPDGPENSSGRSDHTQDPQRPCTFKPRRLETGMWKTNTFKAAGRMVKSGPTFDQLLPKYVKKKVGPNDRPAKRPRSPICEQYQVRPIGPPHQSEKMECHTVQLRPNIPTWAPPTPYPSMTYPYAYIPPPYVPNQIWDMPPSTWDATVPRLGGTQNICIRQVSTTSTRPIERSSIRSPDTGTTRLPDYSVSKADQSDRGAYACSNIKNDKKDIIKIGTADVVIQKESEGQMIFGESANTNKTEDTTAFKIADPKYSMP
jgi:hypothetical protein